MGKKSVGKSDKIWRQKKPEDLKEHQNGNYKFD